jgi:2'-5' RNA ligase
MEQVRSFIAIELPGEVKRKLGELESGLKSAGFAGVRWVNPESIHLTLKFLGNIDSARTGEITGAIERAAAETAPFRLKVEGLGVFPDLRRVRVVWVGLDGDIDTLVRLQKKLESEMESLGFPAESRAFTPHLTLARVGERVSPQERQALGRLVSGTAFEGAAIEADSVNLMRSQLTRQGAVYTRLNSVRLEKVL